MSKSRALRDLIKPFAVVDVNGQLVVIDTAYYDGTPRAAVDEMDAIVNSTTFK